MSGKRHKRNARKAAAGRSVHTLLFALTGAEVLALHKAIVGYCVLVETLAEGLEGRAEILSILQRLGARLQRLPFEPDERLPASLSAHEIRLAHDAIRAYLAAASSFSETALRAAPLEERTIIALLIPLQRRLQAIVSQIKPKGRCSFLAEKATLN